MARKFLAALIATSLICAPAVMAQENFETDFSFSTEELATREGSQAVLKRLEHKVRKECGHSAAARQTLQERTAVEACVSDTMDATVEKLAAFSSRIMAVYQDASDHTRS